MYFQKSIYLHLFLYRLNTIKDFASSFPSLTLHAVNLLLWRKIISLTLFKFITIIRPSTLLRVLYMGDEDLQLREGLRRALILPIKNLNPLLFFHASPHPSLDPSLIAIRYILQKILPVVHIFRFIIMTYLKKVIGIKGSLTNNFHHA